MPFHVYMLASGRDGTRCIGVTNNLARRVHAHREGMSPGFTSRYGVTRLVWYEEYASIRDAVDREKTLKKWRRAWKIALIEASNPDWSDLHRTLVGWTS